MPRRRLIVILAALIAFVGAYSLAWRWGEEQLELGFANWVQVARAQGWLVSTGTPRWAGWPLAVQLDLPDAHIRNPQAGFEWTAASARLVFSLLHPQELGVDVAGDQHLHLAGMFDLPFSAARFHATVPLDQGPQIRGASIAATQLRATPPGGAVAIAQLTLSGRDQRLSASGDAVVSLTLEAHDIDLPPGEAWPLGGRVASVQLDGAVTGPSAMPPGWHAAAARWHEGNGSVEVRHLALTWGPLDLSGSGTVALDAELQPEGAASLRIVGLNETIDALILGRVINKNTGTAAKAVAGLMTRASAAGGPTEVRVPISLQKRSLLLGRIPLLRLPEISWPDGP